MRTTLELLLYCFAAIVLGVVMANVSCRDGELRLMEFSHENTEEELIKMGTIPPDTETDLGSPYMWKFTDPNGLEEIYGGEEPAITPMVAGEWTIELWVQYEHEDPATGEPYVAYAKNTMTVGEAPPLFVDGFESGTTAAWTNP